MNGFWGFDIVNSKEVAKEDYYIGASVLRYGCVSMFTRFISEAKFDT